MSVDFFFVSAEPSGDDLTVSVVQSIQKQKPDVTIDAIGGDALNAIGMKSAVDVSTLGIVGLVEGLKAYSRVVKIADEACDYIVSREPKCVVLVDSWGFSLRVAKRVRKARPDIKLVKLVGPQVWATRPGRAKTLAETVDHLFCIHDFEVPFYEPLGLPCTVIGNPALQRAEQVDGTIKRSELAMGPDDIGLLVLPGSRKSEISRVAPIFAQTVSLLQVKYGERLKPIVLVAPSIRSEIEKLDANWPDNTVFHTRTDDKAEVMAAADLALACSGTVTTELAVQGCPMIVGYKLDWLTWFLADKFLFQGDYITLFNVAAKREIASEYIQTELTPENCSSRLSELIDDPDKRALQTEAQFAALKAMGFGRAPASQITAETLLEMI